MMRSNNTFIEASNSVVRWKPVPFTPPWPRQVPEDVEQEKGNMESVVKWDADVLPERGFVLKLDQLKAFQPHLYSPQNVPYKCRCIPDEENPKNLRAIIAVPSPDGKDWIESEHIQPFPWPGEDKFTTTRVRFYSHQWGSLERGGDPYDNGRLIQHITKECEEDNLLCTNPEDKIEFVWIDALCVPQNEPHLPMFMNHISDYLCRCCDVSIYNVKIPEHESVGYDIERWLRLLKGRIFGRVAQGIENSPPSKMRENLREWKEVTENFVEQFEKLHAKHKNALNKIGLGYCRRWWCIMERAVEGFSTGRLTVSHWGDLKREDILELSDTLQFCVDVLGWTMETIRLGARPVQHAKPTKYEQFEEKGISAYQYITYRSTSRTCLQQLTELLCCGCIMPGPGGPFHSSKEYCDSSCSRDCSELFFYRPAKPELSVERIQEIDVLLKEDSEAHNDVADKTNRQHFSSAIDVGLTPLEIDKANECAKVSLDFQGQRSSDTNSLEIPLQEAIAAYDKIWFWTMMFDIRGRAIREALGDAPNKDRAVTWRMSRIFSVFGALGPVISYSGDLVVIWKSIARMMKIKDQERVDVAIAAALLCTRAERGTNLTRKNGWGSSCTSSSEGLPLIQVLEAIRMMVASRQFDLLKVEIPPFQFNSTWQSSQPSGSAQSEPDPLHPADTALTCIALSRKPDSDPDIQLGLKRFRRPQENLQCGPVLAMMSLVNGGMLSAHVWTNDMGKEIVKDLTEVDETMSLIKMYDLLKTAKTGNAINIL